MGVWEGTEKEFGEFVEILNQYCSSIKVKWELKEHEISFLDTITYKGPGFEKTGRLDMKVYFKPTDTHTLLHHKYQQNRYQQYKKTVRRTDGLPHILAPSWARFK